MTKHTLSYFNHFNCDVIDLIFSGLVYYLFWRNCHVYMYTSIYRTEYLKDGQLLYNIAEAQYFLQAFGNT